VANSIANTPSIVGEQFPDFVIDQIEQRQKVYGSINRSKEQLLYLNSKNAWCGLASSVDIKNIDRFKNTALQSIVGEIEENNLAKNFVLEGGTRRFNITYNSNNNTAYTTTYPKEGISRVNTKSTYNDSAYGYGGLEFGQVPMPGIISATFRSENRGSLRTGEIKIKAFNKTQFEIIDTLFLRLGYTVLFECGWANYFDGGKLVPNQQSLIGKFLDPKQFKVAEVDQYYFLNEILKCKQASKGNYDAMLAKVKNFNWTFNKDGSYDITLSLVSIGDVIESLKMNYIDPKVLLLTTQTELADKEKTRQEILNDPNSGALDVLISFQNTSTIVSKLYEIFNIETANDLSIQQPDAYNQSTKVEGINEKSQSEISNTETSIATQTGYDIEKKSLTQDGSLNYFITFSSFLEILRSNVLFSTSNQSKPGIEIQNQYNKTFIYNNADQYSCDPRICAINKNAFVTDVVGGESLSFFNSDKAIQFNNPTNQRLGDLMAVYLNIKFIISTLESKKNENGDVVLISFLTAICDGINNALGNINKIAPVYDHDSHTLYFVDETPSPRNWIVDPPKAKFELYGYNPSTSEAGFIKDFNLKTELTPAMSTAITVGAQANAQPVGESQTAFSKWNIGLEDRIWKEKNPPVSGSKSLTSEEQKDARKVAEENYANIRNNYVSFLRNSFAGTSNIEDFDSYPAIMKNMISYYNTAWVNSSTSPTGSVSPTDIIGFIPINLSLTMDGLSGIKIYQRFAVDTKFLPSKYTDTLEFIVKGISHTIDNNQWTTNIETFMVPKVVSDPTEGLLSGSWGEAATAAVNKEFKLNSGYYETVKDNNPFNIRPGDNWLGKTGIKLAKNGSGAFVTFDTVSNGVRAGLINLHSYIVKNKLNTLPLIINTYAPPADKNNTSKYIRDVSAYLVKNGFKEFEILPPPYKQSVVRINWNNEKLIKTLAKAIATEEGGGTAEVLKTIDSYPLNTLITSATDAAKAAFKTKQ
jgi:hypothetical protein